MAPLRRWFLSMPVHPPAPLASFQTPSLLNLAALPTTRPRAPRACALIATMAATAAVPDCLAPCRRRRPRRVVDVNDAWMLETIGHARGSRRVPLPTPPATERSVLGRRAVCDSRTIIARHCQAGVSPSVDARAPSPRRRARRAAEVERPAAEHRDHHPSWRAHPLRDALGGALVR